MIIVTLFRPEPQSIRSNSTQLEYGHYYLSLAFLLIHMHGLGCEPASSKISPTLTQTTLLVQ